MAFVCELWREIASASAMKEAKLVVVLLLLLVVVVAVVDCESSSEWQLLTKQNFSSQIRRNPYILLFITLPCISLSLFLSPFLYHMYNLIKNVVIDYDD